LNGRCFRQEEDAFLTGRTGKFDAGVAEEIPKIDMTISRDEGTLAKEIDKSEGDSAIQRSKVIAYLLRHLGREGEALAACDIGQFGPLLKHDVLPVTEEVAKIFLG